MDSHGLVSESTEAGSVFQMGMVRGKKEYFRASEYVRCIVIVSLSARAKFQWRKPSVCVALVDTSETC